MKPYIEQAKLKPKDFIQNWDLSLAFVAIVVSTFSILFAPNWLVPVLWLINFCAGFFIVNNL
jgi:fatty acid desaturase